MKKYKSGFYGVIVVLIFWEIFHLLLDSFIVPEPMGVLIYTLKHIVSISEHLIASSGRIIMGLLLTVVVGTGIGVGLGISEKMDRYVTPIVYLFYPVPRIAFLPIFMILFGLGNLSKIILIFAISVFHMIITVRGSIKDIPHNMYLSATALQLSRFHTLKYMIIPAIMPSLFTSLKIVIGSSIAALFFAENYATKAGIGYYIMNAWIKADYVQMYSGIVAISLFGMGLFKLIDYMQKKLCPWEN